MTCKTVLAFMSAYTPTVLILLTLEQIKNKYKIIIPGTC